jgi:hypothetical protein
MKLQNETPTPLSIRNPEQAFLDVAEECIANGTFNTAIQKVKDRLVKATIDRDKGAISYYSRAFVSFLACKGGSYSILRQPDMSKETLPEAAFEPPT